MWLDGIMCGEKNDRPAMGEMEEMWDKDMIGRGCHLEGEITELN